MIDINKIAPDQIKTDMPVFNPGDHIRVQVRVIEGDKERLQSFEGDVISVRGSGLNKTFTVTATYKSEDKTYIAVDSATPKVRLTENQCEETCYYVYDREVDVRLKYTADK